MEDFCFDSLNYGEIYGMEIYVTRLLQRIELAGFRLKDDDYKELNKILAMIKNELPAGRELYRQADFDNGQELCDALLKTNPMITYGMRYNFMLMGRSLFASLEKMPQHRMVATLAEIPQYVYKRVPGTNRLVYSHQYIKGMDFNYVCVCVLDDPSFVQFHLIYKGDHPQLVEYTLLDLI